MDVREKLVELLKEAPYNIFDNKLGGMLFDSCLGMIADHLINNGVTVQEWISVKDRLPKPFESVLVFRDGKISIDYNEENCWFAYDLNGKRTTHWMPLPKPPKGE